MTTLKWDAVGERFYETGVDHGVLYRQDEAGLYNSGFPWNGLVSISESPSGAEATPQYADNIKYLNLVSAEEFGATIEAYTFPDAFAECDGSATPTIGINVGQQSRKTFGLSYRTKIGNDIDGTDYGYKLHLIYGALAAPTEKAYGTINDSPEAITLSWEITTTPVELAGFKPTATLTIDSTKVPADKLAELLGILYGTAGSEARLPLPLEIVDLFSGAIIASIVPTKPTQVANVVTIPVVAGVVYKINGVAKSGAVTLTEDVIVKASPLAGYKFPPVTDDDWLFIKV